MEKLKMIEAVLIEEIANEFSKGAQNVDITEMGCAIDMLKDVEMIMDMYSKNKVVRTM